MKSKFPVAEGHAQERLKPSARWSASDGSAAAVESWRSDSSRAWTVGRDSGRRRGFTLIELLITMVLIAAVVGLAIPASDRIIHKARATHCLGNLRNLGTALNLYLADHNNIMPELVTARESKESDEAAIDNTLNEYTEDEKVFCCKADVKGLWETTGSSYLWNNLLNGQHTASMSFMGFIRDGSRIPVISDKEGWHKYRDVQVNILYADGHVDKDLRFVVED